MTHVRNRRERANRLLIFEGLLPPATSAILKPSPLFLSKSTIQKPNELAAAILVQTLVDHHPQLQAEIRQDQSEPKLLAQLSVPYKAMLDEMNSHSA
jgi:hypothetical protein